MIENKIIQKNFYNKHFSKESSRSDACFDAGKKYYLDNFISSVIRPDSKKVLEIGCGNGFLTYFILKRPIHLTAIDISEIAIESMKKIFAHEIEQGKLDSKCADILEFMESTDGKYDAIIGSGIIHHIQKKDWKKLFELAHNKLNHGGIFACGPEPNAGGLYAFIWPMAKFFYSLFGIDYDREVEKGTFDMIPRKLKSVLKEAGFRNPEIIPYQVIPHFHLKILEYFGKKIIKHVPGKLSFYIIIKGEKR